LKRDSFNNYPTIAARFGQEAFVTGFGQSDTRAEMLSDGRANPSQFAGQPYETLTGADVAKLVKSPPSVPKDQAQWFIPSTYVAPDARSHEIQRGKGVFRWLTLDVDENNLALADVDAALTEIIGDACRFIYSTRSATQENQKWRGLVPLATEISGADFSDTQDAFFDLLEQASEGVLIPDRALSRPAQLVYLPNRGAFYQSKADQAKALHLSPDHPIIRRRADTRGARAKAEAEAKEARERRMAARRAKVQAGDVSPVDHFNEAHSVADLLARYGYTQERSSNDWRSPFQSSGSYATRDYGEYWISLSGSDAAAEVGAVTKDGHRHGDAFDLFCHFEHGGDFRAAVRAYALEAGLDRQERETPATGQDSAPQAQAQGNGATGDPVDLWGSFDPPELPRGLLPRIIEEFARANGAQMGADPAGLAIAALVTCAAAIPDRVQIKVKRFDEWTESARLWAALMGPPSAKKSPIISAATGPLCRLDVEMMRAWQQRLAEWEALSADERKGTPRPPQTRLRIEDATVEATQQVLEGSPWGVLLLQDELSGFFGAMDKYNGGKGAQADRAFWLRSFNGGQFALNRVGRGAAIIDNLSISMLGGIQPEPLRKIAGDSVDDGLLQRLFPIMLRTATMGRDEPMPPVNAQYRTLIENLHRLTPPGWMNTGVLEFDNGAQAIRHDLEARHLDLQSLETINRKLASHIGKYDGMFARLCVVWHCIEHIENTMLCDAPDFDGTALPATVTEATAQRVADFLHGFLIAHAIAFYSGVLGLSDDHDRLTAIAGYILTHKLDRITNRDVQRGDRTMRGLKDHEIRPLLEQLAALGWLDRIDPPRPSSPPHWQVNPAVHAKFTDRATRETERRIKARATIRDLSKGAAA